MERIHSLMPKWEGALLAGHPDPERGVRGARPVGFPPVERWACCPAAGTLCASETGALRTLGCEAIREVKPGEIVALSNNALRGAAGPAAKDAAGAAAPSSTSISRGPIQLLGWAQRAPGAPEPGRRAGEGSAVACGCGHPRARFVHPGGHRLCRGDRHSVQRWLHQEPLYRADVHRADRFAAQAGRGAEVQRDR